MKRYGLASLLAAVFLCLVSCGGATKDAAVITQETKAAAPRMAAQSMAGADMDTFSYADDAVAEEAVEMEMAMPAPEPTSDGGAYGSASGGTAGAGGTSGTGGQSQAQQERKLIKTGSISLEVEQLASAEESVLAWCQSFGGYVAASFNHESSANYTVRIPSASFDAAMAAAGDLGRVRSRNLSTQDVSEQYYDLKTRLDTRKILRDRLQAYLAQAGNMEDLLQIERELNSTLSEIESMEGRMRRLSNQIDYATITVDMSLPYRTTDQGFQWPSLSHNVRRFLSNVVDFFVDFVSVVLYIIVFGVPILALVAFLYWLLLGKVGLLKKIFTKLK